MRIMSIQETAKLRMTLNVCMLGARGVGKTTVLTAIFDETRGTNGLAGTSKIVISPKSDTRKILSNRKDELLEIFDEKKAFSNGGIKATPGASPYYFAHRYRNLCPARKRRYRNPRRNFCFRRKF